MWNCDIPTCYEQDPSSSRLTVLSTVAWQCQRDSYSRAANPHRKLTCPEAFRHLIPLEVFSSNLLICFLSSLVKFFVVDLDLPWHLAGLLGRAVAQDLWSRSLRTFVR